MSELYTLLHREPWNSFLYGFATHSAIKTILAPIDRTGIILQTQDYYEPPVYQYNTIGEVLSELPGKQGALSYWRGNLVHCIRYIPNQLVNVFLSSQIPVLLKISGPNAVKTPSVATRFISSDLISAAVLFCVYPLDVAYIRLASESGPSTLFQHNGPIHVLKQLYQQDGISALYSGYWLTALALTVYRGTYYWLYDIYKRTLSTKPGYNGKWATFIASTVIAIACALITYPLDTIRKRMIMDQGRPKRKYSGFLDCVAKIMEKEGVAGFFKGGLCVLMREFIGKLILLVV
jgi:solute carrier family 25 (adenine nucleotide translocator) protein 4/5/6/31